MNVTVGSSHLGAWKTWKLPTPKFVPDPFLNAGAFSPEVAERGFLEVFAPLVGREVGVFGLEDFADSVFRGTVG